MKTNSVSIGFRTDARTKKDLEDFSREIGLTVNGLLNLLAKQVLRDRALTITLPSEPNDAFAARLDEYAKDVETGRNIEQFSNPDEAVDFLKERAK
jgi:antitoxin component of RelBE/YafQ-DinJ toxin-antitoxin module